jgi:hypothetical protein
VTALDVSRVFGAPLGRKISVLVIFGVAPHILEILMLLCKYIKCQCISSINAKKWYLKKLEIDSAKAGDVPRIVEEMRAIADEEIKNAEEAINYTDYDSRLGWEPSMEYIADSDHIRWKINMLKKVAQADLDEYLKAAEMEFLL